MRLYVSLFSANTDRRTTDANRLTLFASSMITSGGSPSVKLKAAGKRTTSFAFPSNNARGGVSPFVELPVLASSSNAIVPTATCKKVSFSYKERKN
jgi:hypothetical protein